MGGKFVYGASQGGWKPDKVGYYRITFYVPSGEVNLALGTIANASTDFVGPAEGTKATPVLVPGNNLTYVDVLVLKRGGSGGRKPTGTGR